MLLDSVRFCELYSYGARPKSPLAQLGPRWLDPQYEWEADPDVAIVEMRVRSVKLLAQLSIIGIVRILQILPCSIHKSLRRSM